MAERAGEHPGLARHRSDSAADAGLSACKVRADWFRFGGLFSRGQRPANLGEVVAQAFEHGWFEVERAAEQCLGTRSMQTSVAQVMSSRSSLNAALAAAVASARGEPFASGALHSTIPLCIGIVAVEMWLAIGANFYQCEAR